MTQPDPLSHGDRDQPRLPDFLIAGAAKSATTWLQQSLQQSPGLFLPDPETHFFSRHYADGINTYARMFDDAPTGAVLGEKSNSYLTHPDAAARIHRHLPHVRLVFQLRDPVARAYSDYAMLFRRGEVDDDIARHLDPERAASERFLDGGCYARQLARYYDLFPRDQILVLLYENVIRAPQDQVRLLETHLRLPLRLAPPLSRRVKDSRAPIVPPRLRKALAPMRPMLDPFRDTAPLRGLRNLIARPQSYPKLDPGLKAAMIRFYQPQSDALRTLTGHNLDVWTAEGDPARQQQKNVIG